MEEGGGSVNTQTGSVSVAASQSNIVRAETRQDECSTETDATLSATTDASQGQNHAKTTMEGLAL